MGGIGTPRVQDVAPADDARIARLERAAERGDAQETAREFETLFGTLLVRELRRSMPKGLFGDGAGADVYEGWFDEQLGAALAERDSLGVSQLVEAAVRRADAARAATEALNEALEEGRTP